MWRRWCLAWAVCVGSAQVSAAPVHDAIVHSPHAGQMARADENPASQAPSRPPIPPPSPSPGPDAMVYGYLAYWADDFSTLPWDELSHLALFTAGVTTSGVLTDTARWGDVQEAVALANPYGVRVHLTVANFSTSELTTLLGSASARSTLIEELREAVQSTGAHGVNIDFEGLPSSRRAEMVLFIDALAAAVDEVVLATPAVDWSDAWDYAALSAKADLFIMGYGYHWSGSSYAGPVDPLYGGDPWSVYSLAWTVEDYLANGAEPERVILGLPLYGNKWPTADNSVPAASLGTGSAVFWTSAHTAAATHGSHWEDVSRTPYYFDGTSQCWYPNTQGVRERIEYAVDAGIGGVGFWALNYDDHDAELWAAVREATHSDNPDTGDTDTAEPGGLVANAGAPFLAYVGDTVVLNGEWSSGATDLAYEWTQVHGPSVVLSDGETVQPSFVVAEGGVHSFELVVSEGDSRSEPSSSFVIGVDRGLGRSLHPACGCSSAPGDFGWLWLWMSGLIVVSFRRVELS